MENSEEILQILERYARTKPKEIPEELEQYLRFVATTGETVFKWPQVQQLLREKFINVITEFHDTTPSIQDLPHYPNVDQFNFETMKKMLLDKLDSFHSAPFTVQRICELLTEPRKQYSRIDKFMRAIEKTILVVSCVEPKRKRNESENGESMDSMNGEAALDVETENDHAAANGNKENEEPPKTAAEVEEEIALEKLEPEVSVLTEDVSIPDKVTADEPATDAAAEPVVTEEKPVDVAVSVAVTEPAEVEKMAVDSKVEEPKTEEKLTGSETLVAEEPKDETEHKPSPSKRTIEEDTDGGDVETNVAKKVKLDDEEGTPKLAEEPMEPAPVEVKTVESMTTDEAVVPETKTAGPDTTDAKMPEKVAAVETSTEAVTEPDAKEIETPAAKETEAVKDETTKTDTTPVEEVKPAPVEVAEEKPVDEKPAEAEVTPAETEVKSTAVEPTPAEKPAEEKVVEVTEAEPTTEVKPAEAVSETKPVETEAVKAETTETVEPTPEVTPVEPTPTIEIPKETAATTTTTTPTETVAAPAETQAVVAAAPAEPVAEKIESEIPTEASAPAAVTDVAPAAPVVEAVMEEVPAAKTIEDEPMKEESTVVAAAAAAAAVIPAETKMQTDEDEAPAAMDVDENSVGAELMDQ